MAHAAATMRTVATAAQSPMLFRRGTCGIGVAASPVRTKAAQ
jgi:hypothetical protein